MQCARRSLAVYRRQLAGFEDVLSEPEQRAKLALANKYVAHRGTIGVVVIPFNSTHVASFFSFSLIEDDENTTAPVQNNSRKKNIFFPPSSATFVNLQKKDGGVNAR